MSSPGIDCPGDTISYNCSILSNSETLHLTWCVTFPGLVPINMTYDSSSNVSILDYLGMNISTTLTAYNRSSGYIESIITLTVLTDVNGTELECSISDLDNDIITTLVYSSGVLIRRAII